MTDQTGGARILIYSHDTFGLGHLRRCRAIAHGLVERYKQLTVLILSGSPIIGSFDFRSRVDFVRIPGVIKLRNGDYTSLGLHIDLEDTLAIRSSIIQHTAEVFDPDLFLVDKEPTGLRGEVAETLSFLRKRGTINVLGIRDILDDSETLSNEWDRKNVLPTLVNDYDEIWVYGLASIANPLMDIDLPHSVREKMRYTGYLRREVPDLPVSPTPHTPDSEYILVTPGGGGDGEMMVDWVLRAYEQSADRIGVPAVVVLGPFMPVEIRNRFEERAESLESITTLTFHSHMELLTANAKAVVAMGGYNTFCEILSFDKPALIVPRTVPRKEQLIRATKAVDLGLAAMIDTERSDDTYLMVDALCSLMTQQPPSSASVDNLLNGIEALTDFAGDAIEQRRGETVVVSRSG